jgi:hypothetical protein
MEHEMVAEGLVETNPGFARHWVASRIMVAAPKENVIRQSSQL